MSMTLLTGGSLTLTIIPDLPGIFIVPALNRLASKHFFQSIIDPKVAFTSSFSMLNDHEQRAVIGHFEVLRYAG